MMNQTGKKFISNSNILVVLLGCGLTIISGILWITQKSAIIQRVKLDTESTGLSIKNAAEIHFRNIENVLGSLAQIDIPIVSQPESDWTDSAAFFLDLYVSIEYVTWVDESYRIGFVYPEIEHEHFINQSPSILSRDGSKENIWIPTREEGGFSGFLVGVVDIEKFFSSTIEELGDDYAVKLFKGETTILQTNIMAYEEEGFTSSFNVILGNTDSIQMDITPTEKYINRALTNTRTSLLISLTFSALAVISVFFAQKFSRQSLKNAQRYQDLFGASRDAIFTFNFAGRIIEANQSAQELTQHSLPELREMNLGQLFIEDDIFYEADYAELVKNRKIIERTIVRKDHFRVPVRMVVSIIYQSEEDEMLLGIARDISAQKQAQEQLDAYNDQLEELVEVRTRQLTEINKELSDFAYVVSHDLKAPLRGIMQLSTWIKEDFSSSLNEEGKRLLDLLEKRTLRMHDLIQGILEYSRVGRVQEDLQLIDLNQIVGEIIDTLMPLKDIQIVVEKELPIIQGEYTKMLQVFQNLIGNAQKFMDKNEGWIKVDYFEEDQDLTFMVIDNGPGIENKYFDKIFAMFQTLHARDDFESTGLGLALVKKIIENWGGEIWVESEFGKGSTFFFTIPKSMCLKGAENE